MPSCRRRAGPDPVSAWTRLDPNDGTIPRLQAEITICSQRPNGHRTGRSTAFVVGSALDRPPLGDYRRRIGPLVLVGRRQTVRMDSRDVGWNELRHFLAALTSFYPHRHPHKSIVKR